MAEKTGTATPIAVFAVGFGFMRAWGLTYLGNSGVAFPLESMVNVSIFVFVPVLLLALAAFATLANRGLVDILSRNSIIVCATLTCAGALLISRGINLFYTAEVIGAAGYALLLLQWGVVSSYISFKRLISSLMVGLPIAGFICFVLCFVPQPVLGVAVSALGPAAAWCVARLAASLQKNGNPDINLSTGDVSIQTPWTETGKTLLVRMVVALFLLELVGRSTLMLSGEFAARIVGAPSFSFALSRFLGTLAAAFMYFLLVARSSTPLRLMYLLTPVLLIGSCLFIIFGQMGLSHVTYALAFSAGAWLETAFWLFFSHSFRKVGKSPIYVWAWGRGSFWLSTMVGVAFWNLQSNAFDGGLINDGSALTTFIVFLSLTAMLSYTIVLPESSIAALGMLRSREEEERVVRTSFDEAAALLGEKAKLSPREMEVFLLLAHGRDTAYIQERLVISQGTVCSHRDRIYRKLGVHSKRELIDLVDGAM